MGYITCSFPAGATVYYQEMYNCSFKLICDTPEMMHNNGNFVKKNTDPVVC
jgi:hypothetical protein